MNDQDKQQEIRILYEELVASVHEKEAFKVVGFDVLSQEILSLSSSISVAVLASDIERSFGVKHNPALERLLLEAARRGVSYEEIINVLNETG